MIGEQFQRDRALTGDHQRIVERMHEDAPLAFDEGVTERHRLGDRLAVQLHPRPERLRTTDLHVGRGLGHDDGGVDAEQLRVVGDGLRVVPGTHRHDAGGALGRGQVGELVPRAPFLEGRDELEVLELHDHGAAEHV